MDVRIFFCESYSSTKGSQFWWPCVAWWCVFIKCTEIIDDKDGFFCRNNVVGNWFKIEFTYLFVFEKSVHVWPLKLNEVVEIVTK